MRRMDVASPTGMRTLNLALQGGGSHGAFTWGVLDSLLADSRIDIEGLSGTSAGALNAVVLASGWATALAAGSDPREGARRALAQLWDQVAAWDALGAWQRQWSRLLWGGLPPSFRPGPFSQALRGLSPYQTNPLDINPLRDLLERTVDFEAVARGPLKVFVSATHVTTGKAVIFGGHQLTAQAVMASACLPMLFQAVEIDGQSYWDGGYSANPALTPLIHSCGSPDLVLVQINPLELDHRPDTQAEIMDRISELTFNASLLTQMRSIEFINRLLARGLLEGAGCKTVLMHRIDGGPQIRAYPASTRGTTDAAMIRTLFGIGQQAGQRWLAEHYGALGRHGTVDIRRDYLDDTRMSLPTPETAKPRRGFRPWLAQLFRRAR